jgi:hypothetical protein
MVLRQEPIRDNERGEASFMKLWLNASFILPIFFCLASWLTFSSTAFSQTPHVVTHVVLEDETAWFIASVYYGNGAQYPKLLASNHLTRPEEMKEGLEIRIENPKFFKEQSDFSARYAKLWEGRQKALGLKTSQALPNTKVVIPTESIRNQDNTPKLPFTEVRSAGGHTE